MRKTVGIAVCVACLLDNSAPFVLAPRFA